jgi:hypothetical protein
MRAFILFLAFFLSGSALGGEPIQCDVQIGLNGFYNVDVTDGGLVTVTSRSGSLWKGLSTYTKSGRTGVEYFYLPVTYGEGIEIKSDGQETWMCLDERTCGLCR